MAELKPCPFCGGDAILRTIDVLDEHGCRAIRTGFVQCAGCGVCTPKYFQDKHAIEDWNRRAGERNETD